MLDGWSKDTPVRDIPKRLGKLEGFVDDTLALFVPTNFGVTLG